MSQQVTDDHVEPPSDEPETLALNLAFASIDDLIKEILSRGRPAIVIYTRSERRDEDEELEFSVNGGEGLTRTTYHSKGLPSSILGLLEIVKTDLIRDYFNQ